MAPEHRDIVGEMVKKFGKNWTEFSHEEKTQTMEAAIEHARGDLKKALSLPLLMRFFFETGGEEKWGTPNFRNAN